MHVDAFCIVARFLFTSAPGGPEDVTTTDVSVSIIELTSRMGTNILLVLHSYGCTMLSVYS